MRITIVFLLALLVRVSLAQPSGDSIEPDFSSINESIYYENGKMGLQKAHNKPITPATYDSLYAINQFRYAARRYSKSAKQHLWGIIDNKGQVVLPIKFRKLEISHSFVIVGLQEQNLINYGVGLINGEMLIQSVYNKAKALNNQFLSVKEDVKILVFNSFGEKVLNISADSISMLNSSYAKYYINGKVGILNIITEEIEQVKYSDIKIDEDQILAKRFPVWTSYKSYDTLVYDYDDFEVWDENFIVRIEDKSWVINEDNGSLSEVFDKIIQVNKSLAMVANGNMWGAINNFGKIIIPNKYKKITSDGEFIYAKSDAEASNWTLFDNYGYQRAVHRYDSVQFISEGRIGIKRKGKWGFLNRYGKEIISPIYDKATAFKDDLSIVTFFGEDGIINREGKWVVPPKKTRIIDYGYDRLLCIANGQYQVKSIDGELIYFTGNTLKMHGNGFTELDSTGSFVRNISFSGTFESPELIYDSKMTGGAGLVIFKYNDKFGFKDQRGRIIIANRYEDVRPFYERMAAIKINNKWGFINLDEQLIVQPRYDSVGSFSKKSCIVNKGGLLGVVNMKGIEIIPTNYDKIDHLSNGRFKVRKDNKWGILNENGSVSIPVKYTQFKQVSDQLFIVKKNGKYGTIDSKGVSKMPLVYNYIDYNQASKTLITKMSFKNEWTPLRKVHSESN